MYSRGRGGGTIAGWNFGTKVGKKRKKLVKLRTGSKKRRPSALRIRNRKRGERKREGGGACDLPGARSADIRISESDTDIYSVQVERVAMEIHSRRRAHTHAVGASQFFNPLRRVEGTSMPLSIKFFFDRRHCSRKTVEKS